MKRALSFAASLSLLSMMFITQLAFTAAGAEISPAGRVGQRLDSSLFDAQIRMYDNTGGGYGEPMSGVGSLFDKDYFTAWSQTPETGVGYENWRPRFELTFKDNRRFVINAIQLYGSTSATANNFPTKITYSQTSDGAVYTQEETVSAPPAVWKSHVFQLDTDMSAGSFILEMEATAPYGIILSEMIVFGYEVKGTALARGRLNPAMLDFADKTPADMTAGSVNGLFDGAADDANTVDTDDALLAFSLPSDHVLTEVRLFAAPGGAGFPSSVEVYAESGGAWQSAGFAARGLTYAEGAAAVYVLPAELTGKSFGLRLRGGANVSLAEAAVYGYPLTAAASPVVKLDSANFEITARYWRGVADNGLTLSADQQAMLFNGNYIEQMMIGPVDKDDYDYNSPTLEINFKDGKKYVITEIVASASWELGQFPDTYNVYNKADDGAFKPFTSAVLDRSAFAWNGVQESHAMPLYNFPGSTGFLLELRKGTDAPGGHVPFTLAELEFYGYEAPPPLESDDEQIAADKFTAFASHRDYGNAAAGVLIGGTDISHGTFPIANLFNDNVGDMWTQNVGISEGYFHLKPFVQLSFKDNARYIVTKVEIYGRGDQANWPSSVKVSASERGDVYQDLFVADGVAAPAAGQPYTIQIPENTWGGGKLGLEFSSANAYNDVAEIKVYGHLDDNAVLGEAAARASAVAYPSMGELSGDGLDKLHNGASIGEMWRSDPRTLGSGVNSMLRFDIQGSHFYGIREIRLWPRNDSFEGFPNEYVILTSEDGETFTEVAARSSIEIPPVTGRAIQCRLDVPLSTRYLGVVIKGGLTSDGQYEIDMLSEIELIGKQGDPLPLPEDGDEVINDDGLTLLDPSLFDVEVVFRANGSDEKSGHEANLFDGNLTTEWFPKTPLSEGYYDLKHMIKINFKGDKLYRIDKVRLFGKAKSEDLDNKNQQFPSRVVLAASGDGLAYTDKLVRENINMVSRDSISFLPDDLVTSYLGIEVGDGWMPSQTTISLPILCEIRIFGEEITVEDTNDLNDPDGENDRDAVFLSEADPDNVTVDLQEGEISGPGAATHAARRAAMPTLMDLLLPRDPAALPEGGGDAPDDDA